jgi:hypothetical protein
LAKQRREGDLERFRAAERARQRRRRAARRLEGGGFGPTRPDEKRLVEALSAEVEAVLALALGGQASRDDLVTALSRLVTSAVEAQAG